MSHTPLVSICCITYNHEKFIKDCIEGFLMQKTDFDFEILIHDDSSTDDTQEIIKTYVKKDPSIKAILQSENKYSRGINPFIEYLVPEAKGKYIAICEGDDYWTDPLKLQKQVDFLEANPDYIMCFTNVNDVDEIGNIIKKKKLSYKKDTFEHIDMPLLAPTLTRVMRNKHLSELKWPNVKGGDNFLLTYHSRFGKTKFMDIVTAHYRRHGGGVFSFLTDEEKISHLLNTRLACLGIADYPLKLKLYQKILNYCLYLSAIQSEQYFNTAITETKMALQADIKILKKNDVFKIKKVIFLLEIYRFSKFHKIRKYIKKYILLIYQPSEK